MSHSQEHTSGHDHSAAGAQEAAQSLGASTIEVDGTEITVAKRFSAGMVLTEAQANILQAAHERQFMNNQNALAKSRKEGKNTTPQPDATQLAAMFLTYEPAVGGAPRQSMIERLRAEAAWRFWTKHVTKHNAAAKAGKAPVIVKAVDEATGKAVAVNLGFRAAYKLDADGKPELDAAGKKIVEATADEQKAAFCSRLLASTAYADKIQAELDQIMAERGSKAEAEAEATVSSTDLI